MTTLFLSTKKLDFHISANLERNTENLLNHIYWQFNHVQSEKLEETRKLDKLDSARNILIFVEIYIQK